MINNKFEAYKLKREIKRSGKAYTFKRENVNDFGEPVSGSEEVVGDIHGLYHEQTQTVSIVTGDTTQYRTKKVPLLLCLYDTASFVNIGDLLNVNEKVFKVVGVTNVNEWNIIADISMEEIDYGRRVDV